MIRRALNFFGIFLIFVGGTMLFPLIFALAYKEISCVRAFLITIFISEAIGIPIKTRSKLKEDDEKMQPRERFLLVAFSWIIVSIIASIPFVLTSAIPNPIDAFFEMCSGFSTTGASIIPDVEKIPKSLMMWRSATQWLGGMGVIVLVMAIIPGFGGKAMHIASAETPGPTVSKLGARFSDTAKQLYFAYIILTILEILFLIFGGLNFYDATLHSLSTMATGGFSCYGDSVAHFNSAYVYWIITIFTFLAGMNFNLFFIGIKEGMRNMFKDEELRFYIKYVGFAIAMITATLLAKNFYSGFFKTLTEGAFQVVTIVSTTGFSTTDFDLWPSFCKMIIVILMLTGACSSSTAGGMKLVRVLTTLRMIKREVKLKTHDRAVYNIKYNGTRVSSETLTFIIIFMAFFIFTLLAGTLIISVDGHSFITNFTATLSCLSNVGPGLSSVGPTQNFSIYSNFSTLVLAFTMIAGRLELTTFFIIFSRHFWNPDRA